MGILLFNRSWFSVSRQQSHWKGIKHCQACANNRFCLTVFLCDVCYGAYESWIVKFLVQCDEIVMLLLVIALLQFQNKCQHLTFKLNSSSCKFPLNEKVEHEADENIETWGPKIPLIYQFPGTVNLNRTEIATCCD